MAVVFPRSLDLNSDDASSEWERRKRNSSKSKGERSSWKRERSNREFSSESDDAWGSGKSKRERRERNSSKSKGERSKSKMDIMEFVISVESAVYRSTGSAPVVDTTPADDFNRLFVQTRDSLLHLDLKNSNSVPVPFSAMKKLPRSPPVAVAFDGRGLGVAQTKSDIYILCGDRYVDQHKIFKFLPGGCRLKEMHMKSDPSLKEEPLNPVPLLVELIEGKIYVLRCPRRENKLTLEVFDVSSPHPIWKELKPSPVHVGSWHFVFRNKLYVLDYKSKKFQCFDPCNGSWHEDKYMSKLFGVCEMLIPSYGRMLSEDVMIALKGRHYDPFDAPGPRLQLMGYLYSKDGRLLACQALKDVFPVELYAFSYHLISMEDEKFCALTVANNFNCPILFDKGSSMVLAVSIFSVKLLAHAHEIQAAGIYAAADEDFLSVQVEKQYVFPVKGDFAIEGAFFA